ncbi:ATPase AAA [Candidatus Acidianus copahuensis]|uniref:ATPase AAA n=1 Tax=Candidatus Acidianus copahuensis TaxID=1160895 RepID=A0A031LLI6_9CREN|nr:ATP-binding protein [Candidatus Acidianus copahuensis]EZQ02099.1 ATPase AAA [Candidatus Acidianus copahuensis]
MTADELYTGIKERIEKARALGVTLGDVVGKVSPNMPNKIEEEDYHVNVLIDPYTYYKFPYLGKIGILLGAIDIRTLYFVLLKVIGYERNDVKSYLFGQDNFLSNPEEENPGTLINSVTLKCEMLTKVDVLSSSDPSPADVILEPQSPVIIPRDQIVERALSLNRGSLKLGYLESSETGIKVSLGLDDLNYHMLIVGTTGAGKTSFIKDIISSLYLIEDEESKVIVLDATGDYYHVFLPPDISSKSVIEGTDAFEKLYGKMNGIDISVIFPLTRSWLKKYTRLSTTESITRAYFNLYVKPLLDHLNSKGVKVYSSLDRNVINISSSFWNSRLTLHPFFFRFKDVRNVIYRLNPYFTEQASHFLKIFSSTKEAKDSFTLDDFIKALDNAQFEKLKVHKSTVDNIMRGLYLLKETELFDLKAHRDKLGSVLSEKGKILIFDIYNGELDDFTQKILTYYFLDRVFAYKERQMRQGTLKGRTVFVIDEAHRFFPSLQGSEEDTNYVRRVAGKISTMMRLGRRRRIGFIFATHNPSDLNDIIVQLASTKFVFRITSSVAESMGISRTEARILSWEKNGVAFIISPWLKQGKMKISVPVPPPIGHYDLSKAG